MDEPRPQLFDSVELRVASARWAAGQRGTVIEDFGDELVIEITDGEGRGVEFLELPPEAVTAIKRPQQERLVAL